MGKLTLPIVSVFPTRIVDFGFSYSRQLTNMTFPSSPLRDNVDCFTTRFDFGVNCPLHLSIPAYHLPIYASQCLLPHTTQDSVLDCWLSFVKAVIADRSLPCASRRNPHQTVRMEFISCHIQNISVDQRCNFPTLEPAYQFHKYVELLLHCEICCAILPTSET